MNECVGKIVKGIGGFYYIFVDQSGIYECKAKGIFRKQGLKPLVGDDVRITVLDEENKLGNIIEILPRKKELVRPAVANVDQALVIFAAAEPNPNFNLLDRFLLSMQKQNVSTIICFNKVDIVKNEDIKQLEQTYEKSGYRVCFISVKKQEGVEQVSRLLAHKTTVLAGPSGVGKSTLLNYLVPEASMETGQVSEKIKRGRHTTRHSEIFHVKEDTYVMDTPGFSSLYVNQFEKEEIKEYFGEFAEYEKECRFLGCMHLQEPDCGVKRAVLEGAISRIRYENYKQMVSEVQEQRRW